MLNSDYDCSAPFRAVPEADSFTSDRWDSKSKSTDLNANSDSRRRSAHHHVPRKDFHSTWAPVFQDDPTRITSVLSSSEEVASKARGGVDQLCGARGLIRCLHDE